MKHGALVDQALGSVPRETIKRLEVLVEAVLKWNDTINLVAAANREVIWLRHVVDSLQIKDFLPSDCTSAADLGSGGGFPGLVLAIASGHSFDLVEADKRKAAFLVHAAHLTGTNVRVHACRIEHCSLRGIQVITSRALAPLERLIGYAAPILAPDGMCLFLKGEKVTEELHAAGDKWRMRVTRVLGAAQSGSELLRIDRISRV